MFNPDKYRSVTWLKGGRVYPQLDCFGIVNEIRRDLGLPEWPDFAGVTKEGGGPRPGSEKADAYAETL
ncbi:nitrite transporter [Klebsiella pneumoniae]|nr:nitrite transporter [Klebsiella pneumoniae]